MNLRITPTVEFEPSSLGIQDSLDLERGGEWQEHWARGLATFELRPIRPASWLVATTEFASARSFDLILSACLELDDDDLSSALDPEQLSPLAGGYAFGEGEGAMQVAPGCCCDLSDLSAWQDAFQQGSATLAIGHGVYSIATNAGVTTVRVDAEQVGVQPLEHRSPAAEFAKALEHAECERDRFAHGLEQQVRARGVGAASAQIANVLVCGH